MQEKYIIFHKDNGEWEQLSNTIYGYEKAASFFKTFSKTYTTLMLVKEIDYFHSRSKNDR